MCQVPGSDPPGKLTIRRYSTEVVLSGPCEGLSPSAMENNIGRPHGKDHRIPGFQVQFLGFLVRHDAFDRNLSQTQDDAVRRGAGLDGCDLCWEAVSLR